jgi:hypothetical protein
MELGARLWRNDAYTVISIVSYLQIAILCLEGGLVREKHERVLKNLVADGFLKTVTGQPVFLETVTGQPVQYRLTGKARHLLAERGAGLNES